MRGQSKIIKILFYMGVFSLALFLRLYKLGEIPFGLHVDEAGMAYDAYALANWGMDRYYKFYPVYFINYGGGQSVLYGYLCMFLLKIFEPSVLLYRMPAVCFGMLTWLFGTLSIRESLGKRAAAVGSVLLAICPCFVLHSRMALDCFLFSGASTVALYFAIRAVKEQKGKKSLLFYVLTGISLGISLYTYALSWLAVPVFLVLFFGYLLWSRELDWKKLFSLGIPLGVLALPLLLMVAINTFDLPEIATVRFTIPKLPVYRTAEFSFKNIWNNIPKLLQIYFFNDELAYNSLPTYFSMYLVSVPFAFAGIWKSFTKLLGTLKERKISAAGIVFLWFLAQTCMGVLIQDPNANKMNAVFFSLLFFTVYGLKNCWHWIESRKAKKFFAVGITVAYAVFFCTFGHYYFTEYTRDTFPLSLFCTTYEEVLEDWAEVTEGKTIYTESPYIYYPLTRRLSPMEFQLIEKGDSEREGIVFSLPDTIDENGFYVIFSKFKKYEEPLLEAGFTAEKVGNYTVMYKK